jgi:hypothetical protein
MRKVSGLFQAAGFLAFSGLLLAPSPTVLAQADYKRGDVNSDKRVDIADAVFLLNFIFGGGATPRCRAAANANADSRLDISDAITILIALFVNPAPLKPLTEDEIAECNAPPPPVVLREGSLSDVAEPGHGISGIAQELSDRTIKISNFYYDGTGVPEVVVHLTRDTGFDIAGIDISPDLVRSQPYVNETLIYSLPAGVTSDMFKYVAIWCNDFPLTYGFARLFVVQP